MTAPDYFAETPKKSLPTGGRPYMTEENQLQIIFRFYLPFIWGPWRRHEFEASLIALLKPSLEGHPNASFHTRFASRNCTHA
jgi:hypothetical protein